MRRVHDKHFPKSKLVCPFCGDELNMRFDGFTTYGAVNGPYLRGKIALECSDEACPYRHVTEFHANSGRTIARMENLVASLVRQLPRFGPWERLQFSEKSKRSRRHKLMAAQKGKRP